MPMAPMIRMGLRPTLSMYRTVGIVARKSTMPTTPVARRETVLLDRPNEAKIVGA